LEQKRRIERSQANLEEQSPMVNGNNRSEETDRIDIDWLNEMPDSRLESEARLVLPSSTVGNPTISRTHGIV
jgi:hypothetical protein